PQTPHQVTWHQDLTYWGLGETDDQITAWIALTEANTASGCMRFVPGSHKQQIVGHHDSYASDNLLSRGQEISVDVNESDAVHAPLQPGEMSLHHGRLFHASGPNNSSHRRVGLAIRYITPSVKQLVGERDFAMVARGRDDSGHWVHIPIPSCNYEPSAVGLYLQASSEQDKVLMRNTGQAAT
ncbi:MAG TPA: phytanoyl-CoA dioxygenase family protein, partial [Arenicellales bacterium]|nr:phytanoyl-CoA dioxygenase family protein [Arenicellales bacterium]